jgi:transposase-like protein
MARAGPRKIREYSLESKLTAVRLSQQPGIQVQAVAAAGGWSDVQTLLTCYQQPDPDTLRAVVDREKLTQKLTQPKRQQKSHSS